MNPADLHKFVHDLRNSLNTISINASLVRRLYKDTVDPEIVERLDAAVKESEALMSQFQKQAYKDEV
ncbi:MAG TPA: hypothetical protein VHM90_00905 [Phycisphaerae bacterium]|nr:hypothetical protein [Phycisphaerae bacterium]